MNAESAKRYNSPMDRAESEDPLMNAVLACDQAYRDWHDHFGRILGDPEEKLRIAFNSGYMAAINNVPRTTAPAANVPAQLPQSERDDLGPCTIHGRMNCTDCNANDARF